MKYSQQEVLQYVQEEEIAFIQLAFCDIFGRQKNISIVPAELPRAFEYGIAFDASAIAGFGDEARSDLLLRPDPETLMLLPWRPEHGRVVRMFCSVIRPDGQGFPCDTRSLLKAAAARAEAEGVRFLIGAEQEFYLFKRDENGEPTQTPYDRAGYMDVAPDDKGEGIRREICLTLAQMGILPESAHHEEGPGQNEIDFRYSDPLTAADNVMTFQSIVKLIAQRNGLYADFSSKPLAGQPGSGFHINMSVQSPDGQDYLHQIVAGALDRAVDMTVFLNPGEGSYARLGGHKAPVYVSWSAENRSQLVRIPAAAGEYRRAELRSPDPTANPYLAFTLVIQAGLYGIRQGLALPEPVNLNLFQADPETLAGFKRLPQNLAAARTAARSSGFIRDSLPREIIEGYCGR
ncbi:glutamine synthetase [Colidextribacter sp. OB.20]|uniref:glutamine synthetase family protein n=1 Tax=Colidextribacter sp. OB.20 TaxID=2304568 RepID=UPI0013718842|nr:glutamine synthetase family protein [Colidextribacter sp. OB.20]NBI11275.1 glutamine synthetase [Colidextribacter sp. OB.20]